MRQVEICSKPRRRDRSFALWICKQRNLVASDDKSNLQISVEGMDYLESNPPTPQMVMPLIKASGLAIPQSGPIANP